MFLDAQMYNTGDIAVFPHCICIQFDFFATTNDQNLCQY